MQVVFLSERRSTEGGDEGRVDDAIGLEFSKGDSSS